ncbi:PREDICTED: putative kinase-like protein TMKL1 isoform X2 [Lupinus angustifolius]|uniref:putative kinase-like protein TMKL1 isoform X2 n=1 Tax=Lupinus angustifolius TaxID=3871 RepID=UPI00092EB612|nr:PREDICTED: putative kinase-like protein TMKL1 isoform X2 [Lupinus angustifolius]
METTHLLILVVGLTSATFFVILAFCVFLCRRRKSKHESGKDIEWSEQNIQEDDIIQKEDLIIFEGGEDLTICDILDAPGEVIGKSNYGTLYKALLQRSNKVRLLRFLRPICTTRAEDLDEIVQFIGRIRHPNLVPLLGFYTGPRFEKLLVHPFYRNGNLAQFIRDGNGECYEWSIIYRISYGIAKGLERLHTGQEKPIIHGNLKSKNILLDHSYRPYISDSGLHLLLNPTAGQEMLETSAAQGYKAPELIKMKDASEETDIYSLGVIFLELLSGKEPINEHPTPDGDFYLPNFMRNAVLGQRISDLYHPAILLGNGRDDRVPVSEECILKYFQLALACCSHSPSIRPNIKQVLRKLEEVAG